MIDKSVICKLKGVKIIKPHVFHDDRGYFLETYNKIDTPLTNIKFIQDNESFSKKGTIRGLHYQVGKSAQSKLVRVIKGEIKDIIIDLRIKSKTYLDFFEIILSEENKTQLFVPKGFAHGFSVLSNEAIVAYKVDNHYDKDSERCINPISENLWFDWGINDEYILLSPKDVEGIDIVEFEDFSDNFVTNNLHFK